MINIFLCDDELKYRKIYLKRIKALCRKYSITCNIKCFNDGEQLIRELSKEADKNGIIFIDINMPQIDGISVAKKIGKLNLNLKLIILTVSKKYLLDAFDIGAFNYLIKCRNNDERFEKVFCNAIVSIQNDEKEYILCKNAKESRSILIQSIKYIEVYKRTITVHYSKGTFEFLSTIGEIENMLSSKNFIRIHRSFLVSLPHIESICYTDVKLRGGAILPIGRTYIEKVKDSFVQYYGMPC